MRNVSRNTNQTLLFALFLAIGGCAKPHNPPEGLTDSDTSGDAYFSSLGLSWKNLDGSPITNPDESDSILECVSGKNSASWCKSVCIADTLKYADTQERWSLYKTGYEGDGVCFIELFAYDRTRELRRFAHYAGPYYSIVDSGAMKGRCNIDIERPVFEGAYSFNIDRFKLNDSFSWLNSDGTPYANFPLRMFQAAVFTVLDAELEEEVTYQVKEGWDCFRRDQLSQDVIDRMTF